MRLLKMGRRSPRFFNYTTDQDVWHEEPQEAARCQGGSVRSGWQARQGSQREAINKGTAQEIGSLNDAEFNRGCNTGT